MSSTKSRSRSNVAQMIETSSPSPLITNITSLSSSALQTQQQQQQYVPSLLKIESVVPTRLTNRNMQRGNRLITRSYSTLCGPTSSVATPVPVAAAFSNYKNSTRKTNSNLHHRLKNNGHHLPQQQPQSERFESPVNKFNCQQTNEMTSVVVENGVYKVRRTAREREKQPDRINLDRRGLCTIPLIDNEPNLRLLSLQHNLINTFHIPDCEISIELSSADGIKDMHLINDALEIGKSNKSISSSTTTSSNGAKPLLRQKSRNQLNFSANNHAIVNMNNGGNTKINENFTSTITPSTPFLQKSFIFQGKNGTLKRANSVMINYPSTQTPTIPVSAQQSSIFGVAHKKLISTPSFSMVDANMNNEIAHNNSNETIKNATELQIDANNSYMSSFRFNLSNLVFLDLYNNQIEKISNLDGLKSLTVLLLGKNRISDITGIVSLKQTLRVLDLHGNRITHITQKICQLQELKSLNLAGNLLRQIHATDFTGLYCLKELNLKRNRIKKIIVPDDLHNLERLWLCHNELQTIEDMSSIAKSINLKEITIENNPISLAGDCVSFLVSYLPLLISLNQLQITEQVRRAAHAWRKSKESSDQNYKHLSSDINSNIRREEIISNARTNWELIRSQQANIINGSQRQATIIKKSIVSKLVSSINSSSGSLSSNVENNNGSEENNVKILKSVIEVPKQQIAKLLRSMSNENTSSIMSDRENDINDVEYNFPPTIDEIVNIENKFDSRRSTSSTRPQIDSASESDFVETDEPTFKSNIPTTPPINSTSVTKPQTPVEIVRIVNNINEDNKNHIPPLPSINTCNLNSNMYGAVESSFSSLNTTINSSLVVEKNDEKQIKNIDFQSLLNITANNNKLEDDAEHLCTPIINKEQKTTISIVDIDNSSTISLPPSNKFESESFHKSKAELENSDKLSIISKVTSKTNDSNNNAPLISSANEEHQTPQRQVHSSQANYHQRNRSAARKTLNPPLVRSQTARNLSSHLSQNQTTGSSAQQFINQKKEIKKDVDKDREQGGDYLVEIIGRYLNVYGVGAIKFVDKQWNTTKAQDVHTVKFSYINFNNISPILCRIKVRFPNVEHYVFRETNIICLGQLNALADTQGLKSLTIDPEGNQLVSNNKSWRTYAIWRLNHWGLKQINGIEITSHDVTEAESTYSGLSDLVLGSLPEALLNPLFTRLRVDEMLLNGNITPKEWLMKQADESIRLVVGKEALQWKKPNGVQQQDETLIRRKGKLYFAHMMENTVNAVEKLQKLEYLWPNILLEMIRNTLIDYSQIDLYVKNLMNEVNSTFLQK